LAIGSGCSNCSFRHNGLPDPQCLCSCHEKLQEAEFAEEVVRKGAPKG